MIAAKALRSSTAIGLIATAALVLGGCAASPRSIAPAYVSPLEYANLSCEDRDAESARLGQRWVELNTELTRRRDRDVAAVGGALSAAGGLILLMRGRDPAREAEYAEISGRIQALNQASKSGCRFDHPPPPAEPIIAPTEDQRPWMTERDRGVEPK